MDSATGKSNVFTRINARPAQASHALLGRGRAILLPGPLPEQPLTQAVLDLHFTAFKVHLHQLATNVITVDLLLGPLVEMKELLHGETDASPSRQNVEIVLDHHLIINRILNAIFSIALRHLLKNLDVSISLQLLQEIFFFLFRHWCGAIGDASNFGC